MSLRSLIDVHPVRRREARFLSRPRETQENVLRGLLRKAADTEWGRRFDFAGIADQVDVSRAYRERVPLHDFEAFRNDVRRMRQGEADVTWPGVIRHFSVSSGTVSEGKLIPMSPDTARANRDFAVLTGLTYTSAVGDASWLGGRFLSVPGRVEEDNEHPGTIAGEMSGLMYLHAPWYVSRWLQCVGRDILFMPRWEEKLRAIAETTHRLDVRAIAMVPSWAVVLFPLLIEVHNRDRGSADRRATCVRDVWPNLRVFFSGAVALSSYEALLREQIGGDVDFVESYGASEGVFAYRRDPAHQDMHLHLDAGVYYEFVRMDDTGSDPTRYTIDQVETDVRYRMVVTTCSGLWAYGVGDVVRFTSTDPARIVVAGRTAEMLDRYGEAVFAEEARGALEHACGVLGVHVRDYHVASVAPRDGRMPNHQWLVEFVGQTPDVERFAALVDDRLQRVNRHYVIRRECGAFGPPAVVAVAPDTFRRWLHATRERVSIQTKVPRMSEDRVIADGVLAMSETINDSSS